METAWDGVKIGKDMSKMGLKASSTASIQFTDVKVPKENLLGQPGDGFKIAMVILNYGRLALGAASVGMMEQSLEDMTKRSADRTQFGVPINTFELIQEKMVKAEVHGYVSSAITTFTAGMLEKKTNSFGGNGELALQTFWHDPGLGYHLRCPAGCRRIRLSNDPAL